MAPRIDWGGFLVESHFMSLCKDGVVCQKKCSQLLNCYPSNRENILCCCRSTAQYQLQNPYMVHIRKGMSDDEDIKRKIKDLVKELKDIENKDLITSESSYLTHLSTLTDVSVNTMRRIKKEGSLNQGKWNRVFVYDSSRHSIDNL
ncbi:hypothetical protein evm_004930 [Chilo suppressalis]|nr:hypothetical protein evm_004930 [Chilo suppressalis]